MSSTDFSVVRRLPETVYVYLQGVGPGARLTTQNTLALRGEIISVRAVRRLGSGKGETSR